MSKETYEWLNQNCLIGFTDKRGHAWHYKQSAQGEEPNHYPGAIPLEDVRRRLFNWKPVSVPLSVKVPCDGVDDGFVTVTDPRRQVIVRPDTGAIFGVFKDGYQMHEYDEWLAKQLEAILDDSLQVGSAILLKQGAVASLSVEVPDNITTPEGVIFRPHLTATTSLDGTLATTYFRHVTNIVCDNTHGIALQEGKDQRFKVKHTRHSALKLNDAREALQIVHTIADDFMAEVAKLTNVEVSEGDWSKFLDSFAPMPEDDGNAKTRAEKKREVMNRLWFHDERVHPWMGTAWGVVQAVNTATHHEFSVRGTHRIERNALRAASGDIDKLDVSTLEMLKLATA